MPGIDCEKLKNWRFWLVKKFFAAKKIFLQRKKKFGSVFVCLCVFVCVWGLFFPLSILVIFFQKK